MNRFIVLLLLAILAGKSFSQITSETSGYDRIRQAWHNPGQQRVSFLFDMGCGWLLDTKKITNGYQGNPRAGLGLRFGMDYVFLSGWGIGMDLQNCNVVYDEDANKNIGITYWGAGVVWRRQLANSRWLVSGNAGSGLVFYYEDTADNDVYGHRLGWGYRLGCEAEYLFSPHWGLALSAAYTGAFTTWRWEGIPLDTDDGPDAGLHHNDVKRKTDVISLSVGVRWHLWK